MFNLEYKLRYGDCKNFDTIKPSAILDLVQDVAVRHSDSCGYDMYRLRDMGLAWLLNGIKLHIESKITPMESVSVSTAIKNMKGLFSERGCIVTQNGEVVAKTCASWFLFDTVNKKPIRIPEEISSAYGTHEFGDEFFGFKKPKTVEAKQLYTVRVSLRDLDTNCHLNNQKSAEILMDALPTDFEFSDMSVLYKKAAYEGDELSLCRAEIEGGYYVSLENEQGELCVAGEFTK